MPTFRLAPTLNLLVCTGALWISTSSPAATFSIPSDPSDVEITRTISSGAVALDSISATSGSTGWVGGRFAMAETDFNLVFYFLLPAIDVGTMTDANLEIWHRTAGTSFDHITNMDIWGLGYVSTPATDTAWFNASQTDAAPGIGIASRVLIQDDFRSPANTNSSSVFDDANTDAGGDAKLVEFLNTLYKSGAVGGQDYAVIRLSHDSLTHPPGVSFIQGYHIVATGDHPDAGLHPTLTVVADPLVVPEPSAAALLIAALLGFAIRRRR